MMYSCSKYMRIYTEYTSRVCAALRAVTAPVSTGEGRIHMRVEYEIIREKKIGETEEKDRRLN